MRQKRRLRIAEEATCDKRLPLESVPGHSILARCSGTNRGSSRWPQADSPANGTMVAGTQICTTMEYETAGDSPTSSKANASTHTRLLSLPIPKQARTAQSLPRPLQRNAECALQAETLAPFNSGFLMSQFAGLTWRAREPHNLPPCPARAPGSGSDGSATRVASTARHGTHRTIRNHRSVA